MKNRMKIITLLSLVAIGLKLSAQIDPKIRAKPDDLKMLQGRTVIVEVEEEDARVVAKLSKKEKDADRLQEYRDFIANNNTMLKNAVDKYWKFNSSIEYKTTTELQDIKGKSKDYVIISFESIWSEGRSTFCVPEIWYNRSEGKDGPDCMIFLPPSSIPEKETDPTMWSYVQADYDFAIEQMQAYIKYMITTDKRIYFADYAKKMTETNCSQIKNGTLVIDKDQLGEGVDKDAIKSEYKGPFVITDQKAYSNAFENQEQGKEVVFSFPYDILGGITGYNLMFAKIVVDCSTANIVFYYRGESMGVNYPYYDIRKQVFDYMERCVSK